MQRINLKFVKSICLVVIAFILASCGSRNITTVKSPSGNINLDFYLTSSGEPGYLVKFKNKTVIDSSGKGFEFKEAEPLGSNLKIVNTALSEFNETWEMPWGEQRFVVNHYKELKIELEETSVPKRKFNVIFKVYDDGLGFRYEFPKQSGMSDVVIMDENTQFNLTGDHKCWWTPGDWDIYEHLYNTTKVSEIDALSKAKHLNLAQTYIPENAVNTPVTMKSDDGIYLSFHEANLTNYSGMTLKIDTENLVLQSELVGSRDGSKVKIQTPFVTPWRTIQIAERPGDLIESKLIVNLNEPNILGDISWFEPTKYVGIWWGMHIGESSWDIESGKHGATTENAKKYIDFAAANNIGAVLIEGWNTGWKLWFGTHDREGIFDFVTPYPDYDIEWVANYAKEKGVKIIMHHETSSAPRTYEQQMDTAYALMKRLGMNTIKTGYVGQIIPKGEYHHGQYMVNHYRKVLKYAAENEIAINAHEPIKATGIRRTLPNAISREGLRGQEFNAWAEDGGNPPEHLTIVPFTRMLAGPIDFTPGVFDIKFDKYKKNNQVNTTLAHQLALYVVIYSPVQMACDLVENYEGQPAFQFIRDVAVDWEETKVLDGEIGEFVTIVRKEKDGDSWFLGSVTDENSRELNVALDFLDEGRTYEAKIYKDAQDAHWDKNPTAIDIETKELTSKDVLDIKLAEGGGIAVSFILID